MTPLDLEDIASELREGRPEPTPDFASRLDAWAAEGFPADSQVMPSGPAGRPRAPKRSFGTRLRGALLTPAAGAIAAFLVIIALPVGAVVLGPDAGDDDSGSGSAILDADDSGRPEELSGGPAAADDAAISAPSESRASKQRTQEKSAEMTLSAEPDEVPDVAQEASEVAQSHRGIVDAMNVRTDGDEATAGLQLRIPFQRLSAALAGLSDLGRVESRDQALLDITKTYNSQGKRFNNAQARVSELIAALAAADTAEEEGALRVQLKVARQRLRFERARLRDLKQRGNYSRVRLSVISKDSGWSLGDAAEDAVGVLEAIGGAALIALAVIVPLGALGGGLWWGGRALRRRSRERMLDE